MAKNFLALFTGILFGVGLIAGGMSNPDKVQNFLDISGTWDPSLAFVMGAAILVTVPGVLFARRATAPLLGGDFQLPTSQKIDKRLVSGALLFGAG